MSPKLLTLAAPLPCHRHGPVADEGQAPHIVRPNRQPVHLTCRACLPRAVTRSRRRCAGRGGASMDWGHRVRTAVAPRFGTPPALLHGDASGVLLIPGCVVQQPSAAGAGWFVSLHVCASRNSPGGTPESLAPSAHWHEHLELVTVKGFTPISAAPPQIANFPAMAMARAHGATACGQRAARPSCRPHALARPAAAPRTGSACRALAPPAPPASMVRGWARPAAAGARNNASVVYRQLRCTACLPTGARINRRAPMQ